MLSRYQELSGFIPARESDIMLRMQVLAGEIYKERAYAEYIMRQMFPTTAEGEYLEEHAAQRNLSRKAGTKATGKVNFRTSAEEHEDILIPAGTVVCTTGDMLRFVTDSDAVLSHSANNVSVDATAAEIGSAYNVGVNTIGIIVTPVLGIDAVKNTNVFRGGSDDESDDELRARIAESFRNISNGTNAAYYRAVAMSVDGVYSASAVGRRRGAGTVDVYAIGQGTTLPADTLSEIQTRLERARELNVDVQVHSPALVNVNLYIRLTTAEGYDFDTVAAQVETAVRSYINHRGIGGDILLADVGDVIYHIKGVSGYRFAEGYGSDVFLDETEFPIANRITVAA